MSSHPETSITEIARLYHDLPDGLKAEHIICKIEGHLADEATKFFLRHGPVELHQWGTQIGEVHEWTWVAWIEIDGTRVCGSYEGDASPSLFKERGAGEDGTGGFSRQLSGATKMLRMLIKMDGGGL